jgi:hypothetical protein
MRTTGRGAQSFGGSCLSEKGAGRSLGLVAPWAAAFAFPFGVLAALGLGFFLVHSLLL